MCACLFCVFVRIGCDCLCDGIWFACFLDWLCLCVWYVGMCLFVFDCDLIMWCCMVFCVCVVFVCFWAYVCLCGLYVVCSLMVHGLSCFVCALCVRVLAEMRLRVFYVMYCLMSYGSNFVCVVVCGCACSVYLVLCFVCYLLCDGVRCV